MDTDIIITEPIRESEKDSEPSKESEKNEPSTESEKTEASSESSHKQTPVDRRLLDFHDYEGSPSSDSSANAIPSKIRNPNHESPTFTLY